MRFIYATHTKVAAISNIREIRLESTPLETYELLIIELLRNAVIKKSVIKT